MVCIIGVCTALYSVHSTVQTPAPGHQLLVAHRRDGEMAEMGGGGETRLSTGQLETCGGGGGTEGLFM